MNIEIFKFEQGKLSLDNACELFTMEDFALIIKKGEVLATKLMRYIWLLCDFKSKFREFSEEDRHEISLQQSGLTLKEYENNKAIIINAVELYKKIQMNNRNIRMIYAMYKALDELETYFRTVNFTEKVESGARKGSLLHSPQELMRVFKEAKNIRQTLVELEQQIKTEFEEAKDVHGDRELGFLQE